ncbi:hypothetical protein X474_03200 [Dethiosulfatarculus sandiegensis]|uniref:Uncharacterized protein n=1 Tax=Dethiosulfatarculus sandiegensis TaxID=1429043 RepID=A0A0D2HZQ7_9BACT|nr:hypothetical protein X474_03200 [Dethiosulfatarculus sandiegensis]
MSSKTIWLIQLFYACLFNTCFNLQLIFTVGINLNLILKKAKAC